MTQKNWLSRNRDSILAGIFVAVVWAIVAYLFSLASALAVPIFYGGVAGAMALLCCVAVMVMRRLPSELPVSESNIESRVRDWLDNFRVTVKNDPSDDNYFRLQITLDGGAQMTVLRSKTGNSEYVEVISDLGIRGEAKKLLELFTESEIAEILLEIKVELARAQVGYSGLALPAENFRLFVRVPILPGLTEFFFMSMIGRVEAAMNLVFLTYAKAKLRQSQQTPALHGEALDTK